MRNTMLFLLFSLVAVRPAPAGLLCDQDGSGLHDWAVAWHDRVVERHDALVEWHEKSDERHDALVEWHDQCLQQHPEFADSCLHECLVEWHERFVERHDEWVARHDEWVARHDQWVDCHDSLPNDDLPQDTQADAEEAVVAADTMTLMSASQPIRVASNLGAVSYSPDAANTISAVPEPSTPIILMTLLLSAGLAGVSRRKR